jgi:glucoamylase
VLSMGAGRPVEQPDIVRARYVDHAAPAVLPLTVTAPATGSVTDAQRTTVTGTTAPRADVTVAAAPIEVAGATTKTTVTADARGRFSAEVALGFGTNVVTVAASTAGSAGGTAYARVEVVSTAVPGTLVLDAVDPSGDDHGPGTFAYPTAADFHDGAFDLERFQVIDAGDVVYLRAQLRDLTPTFGSPLGAQLLDVFVRDPGATRFSTAPSFPQRNYAIAADSAWSALLEVQGFRDPTFVDAGGGALPVRDGALTVTANQATRSILVSIPKSALGQPGTGWVFTVVLHGQDGFSGDQARGFAPTAQPFQFGLCPVGGGAPVCGIDPGTAPKVMDTIPPSGTGQSTELDPTLGPVTLRGITVG